MNIANMIQQALPNGSHPQIIWGDSIARLTPEEIAMLPDWYSYKPPGIGDEFKIFQKDGKAVSSQWKTKRQRWDKPRETIHSDLREKSIKHEHVFPLIIGKNPLNEHALLIGFNYGDEPLIAAQRVIDEYNLDETEEANWYLESISGLILKKQSEVTVRMVLEKKGLDVKFVAAVASVLIVLGMYVLYLLLLPQLLPQRKKRKKAIKPDPKKSPLLCHQPMMKKTIYVKLSATKRLNGNQGRKIKGLISKSGVEYIELEKKTGQPTVMHKIEASNGVVYVPVHMKGIEEAVQKAVVLIQEAVGTENVNE